MNKTTIVIVDHDNYTRSLNRRINLARKIEELGYTVRHYPFIWGNEPLDNPQCEATKFILIGDILFVHSNNTCANEFINHICSKSPTSWVIEYSGGGMASIPSRASIYARHILYPKPVGEDANLANLKEFLEAVTKQEQNAGDILLGYNPLLEAKLELLHKCLTPQGSQEVLEGSFPEQLKEHLHEFLNEGLSELNPLIAELENKKYEDFAEKTVAQIVKLLSGGANGKKDYSDYFSPEYLKALSALREALLGQKSIEP